MPRGRKKKIELARLDIAGRQLSLLSEDEVGFFVALEIASNTISLLQIMIISILHSMGDDGVAKHYAVIRYSTCLRMLGGVISELSKTIVNFRNSLRGKGLKIDMIFAEARYVENELWKNPLAKVMKTHRDIATNHYDFKALGKVPADYGDDHIFSIYLHRQQGNSISMMGEEVAYLGLIGKAGFKKFEDTDDHWDFIKGLCRRYTVLRERFIIDHVSPKLGGLQLANADTAVCSDLVANIDRHAMPLFFLKR